MIEVWGRKYSSNVIPVMWAIGELGLDHVLHPTGGSFGGLDTDAYARMNPNRLIPTIRDGDFVLWESNAIIRYLSGRYGRGTLWPEDRRRAAVADQWMDWSSSRAFPAVFPLFWGTVRTAEKDRDPAAVARQAVKAAEVLAILDGRLNEVPYVAGDELTMGDIPLGAVAYRYFNVSVERPPLPHIEAWYRRLCERPAFKTHVMNFFGTNPQEWAALERASGPSAPGSGA